MAYWLSYCQIGCGLKPAILKILEEKFGLSLLSSAEENVYDYPSSLAGRMHYESILSLMWKYKTKLDLAPVNCLLSLMLKSDYIRSYMINLPAPNYDHGFIPDWLRSIIEAFPSSYSNLGNYWTTQKTEEYEKNDEFESILGKKTKGNIT